MYNDLLRIQKANWTYSHITTFSVTTMVFGLAKVFDFRLVSLSSADKSLKMKKCLQTTKTPIIIDPMLYSV